MRDYSLVPSRHSLCDFPFWPFLAFFWVSIELVLFGWGGHHDTPSARRVRVYGDVRATSRAIGKDDKAEELAYECILRHDDYSSSQERCRGPSSFIHSWTAALRQTIKLPE
jgi:hypothetical protein